MSRSVLDYVEPKKIRFQIEEFQSIIRKSDIFDIIKITLNANPSAYETGKNDSNKELEAETINRARIDKLKQIIAEEDLSSSAIIDLIKVTLSTNPLSQETEKNESSNDLESEKINRLRFDNLKEILGEEDLFPSADISLKMMAHKNFPHALSLILKYAANLAQKGNKNIHFQPLTCFSYQDGQQMMTLTGIILDNEEVESFFDKTSLKTWELSKTDWSKPRPIDIPDLTIRERLFIDQLLPNSTPQEIQDKLEFQFDRSERKSLEMLKTYIMFYRQSPYFSRILV